MFRLRVVLLGVALVAAAVGGRAMLTAASSAAPRPCGNAALAVTAGRSQGATGHGNFVLRFRNITGRACTLRGYPGLDAVGRRGRVLEHAKRTRHGFTGGTRHGVRTVLLAPRRFASADVEWRNVGRNGRDCTFSALVYATPAGTRHTVHLNKQVSLCGLQVHPTVSGKSGNG
jgi:hypothetical protein